MSHATGGNTLDTCQPAALHHGAASLVVHIRQPAEPQLAGPEAGVGIADTDFRRSARRFRDVEALHHGFEGPERRLEVPLHFHVAVIQAGRQACFIAGRSRRCAGAHDQAGGLSHQPGDQSAHDRRLRRWYPLAEQRQPFAKVGVCVEQMAGPHVREPAPPVPFRASIRGDRQGMRACQSHRIADEMDRLFARRGIEGLFARAFEIPDGRPGFAGLAPMVRQQAEHRRQIFSMLQLEAPRDGTVQTAALFNRHHCVDDVAQDDVLEQKLRVQARRLGQHEIVHRQLRQVVRELFTRQAHRMDGSQRFHPDARPIALATFSVNWAPASSESTRPVITPSRLSGTSSSRPRSCTPCARRHRRPSIRRWPRLRRTKASCSEKNGLPAARRWMNVVSAAGSSSTPSRFRTMSTTESADRDWSRR